MPSRPVRSVLPDRPLVSAPPDLPVVAAARLMTDHCCGSIVVLEGEKPVGIFTERDLTRRVVAAGRDPAKTVLREVMTLDPDTIGADAAVADAVRLMDECCYKHLPVVDGGRVIGVLAPEDIPMSELLALAEELEERHRLSERMW